MAQGRTPMGACEYGTGATAGGAAVVICTGPAFLWGMSAYASTGISQHTLSDATASGSTNIVMGARTSGTGVCGVVMLMAPVKMNTGIVLNSVVATAIGDRCIVYFTKA